MHDHHIINALFIKIFNFFSSPSNIVGKLKIPAAFLFDFCVLLEFNILSLNSKFPACKKTFSDANLSVSSRFVYGEAPCAMYYDVINIGLVAITWKGDIGNVRLVIGIVSLHVVLVSVNEISRFLSQAG
jgi:hypothetical protein